MTSNVRNGYFAAATADLSRQSIVQIGDSLEVTVTDTTGEIASEKFNFTGDTRHACKCGSAGNA